MTGTPRIPQETAKLPKRFSKLHIARGILFVAIAVVFFVSKLYHVFITKDLTVASGNNIFFQIAIEREYFYFVMKESWANFALGFFFIGLGVTEIIEGVRK